MAVKSKKKHPMDSGWSKQCIVDVEDWLDEDNLLLIAGWTRDGYTYQDIARKIGVSISVFNRWRKDYPEFNAAMKEGREIVDYKVENALLKSALGFETKESKVTVLMRYGKVVEKTTETTTKEVAPNVAAIQTWLYNRIPDKWNRRNGNLAEDLGDDGSIHIEVTRAKHDELNETKVEGAEGEEGSSWEASVNESLTIRKATKEEQREAKQKAKRSKQSSDLVQTVVEVEDEDEWDGIEENDPDSEDYWPSDEEWESMKKAARKQSGNARTKKRTKREHK